MRGGNRSGKTTWGAVETVWWLTGTHPYRKVPIPCKGLCVANDWALVGDPIWKKLSEPGGLKVPGLGTKTPPILPSRHIENVAWALHARRIPQLLFVRSADNSISSLEFKSAEAGEKRFMGAEFDFIWNDEEMGNPDIFQEEMRALVDRSAHLWWTATPLARAQPLIDLHEMAEDPASPLTVSEEVISFLDNPYIEEQAKIAFVQSIPEEMRPTRIEGEFLVTEGLVYGEWSAKTHEVAPHDIPPEWPRVIAIDPGYHDPCAVLWVAVCPPDPSGRLSFVAYRELYERRANVPDMAASIVRASSNEGVVRVYIDSDALKHTMGYSSSILQQFNEAFKKLAFRNAVTGGVLQCRLGFRDVPGRIYRVKQFLELNPSGIPAFRAFSNLREFKREIRRYMWPKDSPIRESLKPVDKYNHLMDCMGYVLTDPPVFTRLNQVSTLTPSARIVQYVQERRRQRKERDREMERVESGGPYS